MSRVYVRQFALFLLCSGIFLYLVANVLIGFTVHGHHQKVVVLESKRQPLSIKHQNRQQRVHNSSRKVARSENIIVRLKEERTTTNKGSLLELVSEQVMKKDILSEGCPSLYLVAKNQPLVEGDVTCVPHRASTESCSYAAEHFRFDRHLLECLSNTSFKFCSVNNENEPSCVFPKFCSTIHIDGIDEENGNYVHFASCQNTKSVTENIRKVFYDISKSVFKFMFISCRRHDKSLHSQQLLPVTIPRRPPSFRIRPPSININIVLIDSLSRPHFYRSLPLLIREFNRINKDRNSHGEVLDFVSFQSLHGHSAENAHALFTGTFLPKNLTERERERAYVGIGSLYGRFKQAGYTTMYQDDLCWKNFWGMRLELGFPKTWKNMLQRIKEAQIDETGKDYLLWNHHPPLLTPLVFESSPGQSLITNLMPISLYSLTTEPRAV